MSTRRRQGGGLIAAAGALLVLGAFAGGAGGARASSSGPRPPANGNPSLPQRRPGYYGVRWGNQRPPELPADAWGTGDAGGARTYGLAVARQHGNEDLWLTTVDRMGKKESGWTTGRPADAFGGNKRAWGVFQYLTSAVESEPLFGEWQYIAPWYHPADVEIGAPIAKYRDQWEEAESRSDDPLAPVAGVFLWQAAPAWRRRYWAALEQGEDWYTALGAATGPTSKPEYQDLIANHVLAVVDAAGGAWNGPDEDDLVRLSELHAALVNSVTGDPEHVAELVAQGFNFGWAGEVLPLGWIA